MNSRVETATLPVAPRRESVSLPAGAGVALAVLVGSLVWMGIFALMM